ncbi:hypothetical protein MKX03_002459 [Papaver bracteatum]|nr:hypothetical protein MKX03_002459 [Papaver bracteatum]
MKRGNWKCKSVSGDNELQYCEKHYKDFTTKKKMKENEKELPPDENRCCQTSNRGKWRCRNFRMGHGISAAATDYDDNSVFPKTKFCEKHYYDYAKYYKNKLLKMKKNGNGEGAVAGSSATGSPIETRASKRRKKVTEEDDRSVDETGGIQPDTCDDTCE